MGEERTNREDGQNKVLQRTRSRRRFMDSARSHLKDYIEQTITNQPFFSRWVQFPTLPFIISLFPPLPVSIPSVCRRPREESSNCSLMTMRRQVAAVQLYFMGISWCRYWLRFLIPKRREKKKSIRGKRDLTFTTWLFEGIQISWLCSIKFFSYRKCKFINTFCYSCESSLILFIQIYENIRNNFINCKL